MRVLLASMGFTIDFIARRIARGERVSRVVAVGLKLLEDPGSWDRVENAYRILEHYLKSSQIRGELRSIEYSPQWPTERLLGQSKRLLDEMLGLPEVQAAGDCGLEVYLAGGPRILVTSMAVMAFAASLDPYKGRSICITSSGEGFEAWAEVRPRLLIELANMDEEDKRLLLLLRDTGGDILEVRRRTGWPRSTLYKRLEELRERGLVERGDKRGVWKVHPLVDELL